MVAQAAQRSARMIAAQAEREGWLIAPPPSHDIGAKVREVANMLVARIEEASRAALENGGIINKSEIDLLAYLIKSLNGLIGIEGDSRAEELARQKQITRNDHARRSSSGSTNASSNSPRSSRQEWSESVIGSDGADLIEGNWVFFARLTQYPVEAMPANWLVTGGRGAGKTRLGAEWVGARRPSPRSLMPTSARATSRSSARPRMTPAR